MAANDYTPVSEIANIVQTLRTTFQSGKTKDVKWRKAQLQSLAYMIQDNEKEISDALRADLGRSKNETYLVEISGTMNEILDAVKNIEKWAKPERPSVDLMFKILRPTVYKEPKGVALILGTWNYPVTLVVNPLVGAIAAGCPAAIKCSELAPTVASLLKKLIPKYLDPSAYAVILGEVDVINRLLQEPWGHIVYTGNSQTARLVAGAAAKTLTPCTLELGGKNPLFVDPSLGDLDTTARRILWAKRVNCGQTCIAPDFLVVPEDKQDALVDALKKQHDAVFPVEDLASDDYPRIISQKHFDRLDSTLKGTAGTIVVEGKKSRDAKMMGVSIVKDVKWDDELMKGEIFGPLMPIVPVKKLDDALDKIYGSNPLALYVFSKDQKYIDHIRAATTSGSIVVNDTMIQHTLPELPFGGVGESGQGNYHSKKSFDMFTHERSSLNNPLWADFLFGVRYYPYTDSNANIFRKTVKKINFPRPSSQVSSTSSATDFSPRKLIKYTLLIAALALLGKNWGWLVQAIPKYKLVRIE